MFETLSRNFTILIPAVCSFLSRQFFFMKQKRIHALCSCFLRQAETVMMTIETRPPGSSNHLSHFRPSANHNLLSHDRHARISHLPSGSSMGARGADLSLGQRPTFRGKTLGWGSGQGTNFLKKSDMKLSLWLQNKTDRGPFELPRPRELRESDGIQSGELQTDGRSSVNAGEPRVCLH